MVSDNRSSKNLGFAITCRRRLGIASEGQPRPICSSGHDDSGSPIAVNRNHIAEWLFPLEKATFNNADEGICIGDPL